jgi:transposase
MSTVLKYVAGIDVAKKELVVCLGKVHEDLTSDLFASKTFSNNTKGFEALTLWTKKLCRQSIPLRFVMEATGVYHEGLVYYLHDNGYEASVVMPSKISNYARTLEIKTVTDRTAAEAITQFGLERRLDQWQKPKEIYKRLRQLCRERDQLVVERTAAKNQLHAEQSEAFPNARTIKRVKERLRMLDRQEVEIKMDIESLIAKDTEVQKQVKLICTIPGIGILTAVTILAETNGFELIRNRKQLASYAGLDIKEKQSGTSVKGKPRISKRGNKYLRKAMHMPAIAAIRSERVKSLFARLVSKHGIKMKAVVAVQRKLLEMTFTIFKTQTAYDKVYLQKIGSNAKETALSEA